MCLQSGHEKCEILELDQFQKEAQQEYINKCKEVENSLILQKEKVQEQLRNNLKIAHLNEKSYQSQLSSFIDQIIREIEIFAHQKKREQNQLKIQHLNHIFQYQKQLEKVFISQMQKIQAQASINFEGLQKFPQIDQFQEIQNLDPIENLRQSDQKEISQSISKEMFKLLNQKNLSEAEKNQRIEQNVLNKWQVEDESEIQDIRSQQSITSQCSLKEELENNWIIETKHNQLKEKHQKQEKTQNDLQEKEQQDKLQQRIKELEIQNQELKHQFSQNFIHIFEQRSNKLHCYNYENKDYYYIKTQIYIPLYHRSIQYQNKFYLVGGEFLDQQNSYQSSNQVWQVGCDGKCMKIQTLQQARSSFGIAVAKGIIYVVGGAYINVNRNKKEREILNKVEYLKIGQSDSWEFCADLPDKTRNLTLVSDQEEENIYSFGGANEQKCSVNTIYKYNIQSDIWQCYEKTLPQPLCDAAVILDPLVVFGGKNWQKQQANSKICIYDSSEEK